MVIFRPIEKMFRNAWQKYKRMNDIHPLTTKMITTGSIYFCGEVVGQKVQKHFNQNEEKSFDYKNLFRMTLFGTVLLAPYLHYYFHYLDKWITLPGNKGVFTKLLFDQTIGSSIFCVAFPTYLTLTRGGNLQDLKNYLKENFFKIVTLEF
jgi:hypothetical protein